MALTLFEKLDQIESRYEELTGQLSSPEVLGDSARYQKLAKMHAEQQQSQRENNHVRHRLRPGAQIAYQSVSVAVTSEQNALKEDEAGRPQGRRASEHRQQLLGDHRLDQEQKKCAQENDTAVENEKQGHRGGLSW